VKVTEIVQVPLAATVVQLFIVAKALALVPEMVMLLTVRLLPPVFERVTDIGAEVVVDGVLGNVSALAESVAVGGAIALADELDEQPASKERKTAVIASPEMR
jgi:hypothetical protein